MFKVPSLKQPVSRICWHPDGSSKFLACYAGLRADEADGVSPSHVWDVSNPNAPIIELVPHMSLVSAQYYSRNADLIAGGDCGGRVQFFDLRAGSRFQAVSSFENSHHEPVFDVSWLQSKTHSELVSVSPDSRVLWWDTRNLSAPTDSCILQDGSRRLSGCCLEWLQEAGPTKYLVGTEEGIAVALNKKPKKPTEIGGWFGAEDHGGQWKHHGPIYSVKRNFFHPKIFMTVGDWTVKLWAEDLKAPLFQTAPSSSRLTCGGWSPARAGVFFAARFDGSVDFYDYNYQMNETAYSHQIGDQAITACAMDGRGQLLAAGDAAGVVTLVRVCDELAVAGAAEKSQVGQTLDREARREKHLDAVKKMQKPTLVDPNRSGISTIDQNSYIDREREWLAARGISSADLTVAGP